MATELSLVSLNSSPSGGAITSARRPIRGGSGIEGAAPAGLCETPREVPEAALYLPSGVRRSIHSSVSLYLRVVLSLPPHSTDGVHLACLPLGRSRCTAHCWHNSVCSTLLLH